MRGRLPQTTAVTKRGMVLTGVIEEVLLESRHVGRVSGLVFLVEPEEVVNVNEVKGRKSYNTLKDLALEGLLPESTRYSSRSRGKDAGRLCCYDGWGSRGGLPMQVTTWRSIPKTQSPMHLGSSYRGQSKTDRGFSCSVLVSEGVKAIRTSWPTCFVLETVGQSLDQRTRRARNSDCNSGSLNSAIPACSDTHLGEGGKSTNSRIGHRVCLQLFLASVSLAVGTVSCGATNGQPCHCWSSISDLDLGQSAPETYEHFPSPVNSTELRC